MSSPGKRKLNETKLEGNTDNKRQNVDLQNVEAKILNLVNSVLKEEIGKLVILVHDQDENPYVTLQNALANTNMTVCVSKDILNTEHYELQINGRSYASGKFPNMQLAKKGLAEAALEKLKQSCFFIYKKKNYVNVTKKNLEDSTSSNESSQKPAVSNDSIAHKIMMKMGWTGGGLGAQEQGNLDTVILCENVNRQGLGTSNLMANITKKLADFSKSSELLTLVFDADFTKEERMLIHKAARKFNLKSKSTGTECRKLMVSKKITRMDIVKELLKVGGEDGLYNLHIPTEFSRLWQPN